MELGEIKLDMHLDPKEISHAVRAHRRNNPGHGYGCVCLDAYVSQMQFWFRQNWADGSETRAERAALDIVLARAMR